MWGGREGVISIETSPFQNPCRAFPPSLPPYLKLGKVLSGLEPVHVLLE